MPDEDQRRAALAPMLDRLVANATQVRRDGFVLGLTVGGADVRKSLDRISDVLYALIGPVQAAIKRAHSDAEIDQGFDSLNEHYQAAAGAFVAASYVLVGWQIPGGGEFVSAQTQQVAAGGN